MWAVSLKMCGYNILKISVAQFHIVQGLNGRYLHIAIVACAIIGLKETSYIRIDLK